MLVMRVAYTKHAGAVYAVDSKTFAKIMKYKDNPKELTEILRPEFNEYVKNKRKGLTR